MINKKNKTEIKELKENIKLNWPKQTYPENNGIKMVNISYITEKNGFNIETKKAIMNLKKGETYTDITDGGKFPFTATILK